MPHEHRRPRRRHLAPLVLALLAALLLVACGGGGDDDKGSDGDGKADGASGTTAPNAGGKDDRFVAQVASYELVAGQDQRFLAALAGSGSGTVVSFGTVNLDFFYLGTREKPLAKPDARNTATATFLPVAGQQVDAATPGPKEVRPSEGLGVYAAEPVRFDDAGYWGVKVRAKIDGAEVSANSTFEVRAEPQVPFPGQPAPRTANPTVGAAGVEPASIDSRAKDGTPMPDEILHRTSIADALAAGRPTVVVVSTPVYCVSRFCGPITDAVQKLAEKYEAENSKLAFVHLEVWRDFEKKLVNPAAREWITPKNGIGDTQEPWVFLIGGDGTVKQRLDNVVGDEALAASVARLAADAA
jgi:hypothetical protein